MIQLAYKNSLIEQTATQPEEFKLEDIPVFYPSETEFQNPIEFIEGLSWSGEIDKYGACKIVAPDSFRQECCFSPDEKEKIPTWFQTLQELGRCIPFKENLEGMTFKEWKR